MKFKEYPLQIGLGTAAIGRPEYINLRQGGKPTFSIESFRNSGLEILDEAYRLGIRYFDTAPGYGMAEQLLIDWLVDKKHRDVEVATKWGYTYVANFDPKAKVHEVKDHSMVNLNKQWKQSHKLISNLSTYQIHSATLESGILKNTEALSRLSELKNEHGVKIGITTTGANQAEIIRMAMDIEYRQESLFEVYQVTYNLLDQNLANLTQELVAQNKRIIVKEALANGRVFRNSNYPQYANLYSFLQQLAEKYQVGVDAIALRFCIDSIDPFIVLSGASQKSHISANLQATKFELEHSEIEQLRNLSVSPEMYWIERKQLVWN